MVTLIKFCLKIFLELEVSIVDWLVDYILAVAGLELFSGLYFHYLLYVSSYISGYVCVTSEVSILGSYNFS